jgi:ubiquitin C-terminal hydrolase
MENVFFKLKLQRIFINYAVPGVAAISLASFLHQYYKLVSKSQSTSNSVNSVSGLANFGQTCYLNALLQALGSCETFIGYLEDAGPSSELVSTLARVMQVVKKMP